MESTTSQAPPAREEWHNSCIGLVSKYFDVDERRLAYNREALEILLLGPKPPMPWDTSLNLLYRKLVPEGCYPRIIKRRDGIYLMVLRRRDVGSHSSMGIILALTTLLTVYLSGTALQGPQGTAKGIAWSPWGYLLALLIPLFIHEFGHWIVLRLYMTPASIPYLLPAPPIQLGFIGTFGAVINLRWLPPNNRALALSAISGPLAGFLAALPFAYYGLRHSIVLPASAAGGTIPLVPLIMFLLPGPPTPVGAHEVVVLSGMGFAAFVVFFVTFLNLIPVATLDGGHLVRALLGYKGHMVVSYLTVTLLIIASIKWPMLSLFTILAAIFLYLNRKGHPGTAMGILDTRDPVMVLAGAIYLILLVLTVPIPTG